MFSSLKLGKLFGIDLYVHGTFWLLPLFVLFGGALSGDVAGATFDVAVLLAIFGCVALHEVGHAVAAGWYGIRTRDITLYPVGGVASLERMPERPFQEIVIALAGPAVNVLIAAGLLAGVLLEHLALPSGWSSAGPTALDAFTGRLLLANVFLAAFNLLPAFPMDGGRVLRAVLSFGMPRLSATRVAATVGAVLAAGFFLVGLVTLHLGLLILAPIVFLLGQAELAAVRAQEARREWARRVRVFFPPFEARTADTFTGWTWDPARRVWTEWHNGAAVREVYPD
jgi:Zn-dependent protease